MAKLVFKGLLVSLLSLAFPAMALDACPAFLEAQLTPNPEEAWVVIDKVKGKELLAPLSNVMFYSGHPENGALLKHENMVTKEGWSVAEYRVRSVDLWVVCDYFNSSSGYGIRIARKLNGGDVCDVRTKDKKTQVECR